MIGTLTLALYPLFLTLARSSCQIWAAFSALRYAFTQCVHALQAESDRAVQGWLGWFLQRSRMTWPGRCGKSDGWGFVADTLADVGAGDEFAEEDGEGADEGRDGKVAEAASGLHSAS
jgi:hypothetical protein